MEKTVSIILSIFNSEKTLDVCITSMINQTYSNWELIICNDGSKDSSDKIIKKYMDKDRRIKYISNPRNMGLAFSLNRCIENSSGQYIARQDADDISKSDRIEKQINFLEKHPEYAFVGCFAECFDDNGIWAYRNYAIKPGVKELMWNSPFVHPAVIFRKECLEKVNYYTVAKYTYRNQDYDLWFKLYSKKYIGYNMPEYLYKISDDRNTYKRRKFKYRIHELIIKNKGFKLMEIPVQQRYMIFKPIIAGIIPYNLMRFYHSKKFRSQGEHQETMKINL